MSAMVRNMSRLAAVAIHAAVIGVAMSMPTSTPVEPPKQIPIVLTVVPPPEPPAPKVEAPKPDPKPLPKPAAKETPPPPPEPQPMTDPPPQVIASAETSVAQSVAPPPTPPPPPLPPKADPAAMKTEDDYYTRLLGWLERHKRYPTAARSKREEGTPYVRFTMDRSGRVTSSRIQTSSGSPTLDDAALKLLERASPLPAVPNEIKGDSIQLVVPVQYFITG